jgi:NADH-quinone oxidoreductase subunit L
MPWTFWTYTMGYLALAGIVPFAGFWSKDEILLDAFAHGHWVVYAVLTLAAFLTAFYMTRQWWAVFFGSYRGDNPVVYVNPEKTPTPAHNEASALAHDPMYGEASTPAHWHEDATMIAPLVVLAAFAVTAGFFNLPFSIPGGHWLSNLWGQEAAPFNLLVAGVSLIVAAAGIAVGYLTYRNAFVQAQDSDPLQLRAPGVFKVLQERLYVDEFYAGTVGRLAAATARFASWLDRNVIGRFVNGVGIGTFFVSRMNFIIDDTLLNDGPDALADGTVATGNQVRRTATGKVQDYVGLIFAGVVVLAIIYLYGFGR